MHHALLLKNKLISAPRQMQQEIRTAHVTRYVTPLREGGSLPAIVEADDGFV
jgi:hypothetical protein